MRKYPEEDGELRLAPSEYGKDLRDGNWYARPPDFEYTANLARHEVTEHEDGTITVSPSILVTGHRQWHDYLERGIWCEC